MTGPGVVEGRVRRAASQLEAARVLTEAGRPHQSVHHLYFAVFHVASALLATAGVAPETHRGTQQMFSLHFVKPGFVPAVFGVRFAQLMTLRGLSDYGIGEDLPGESVEEARASALAMLPPLLALLRERAPEAAGAATELETTLAALRAAGG